MSPSTLTLMTRIPPKLCVMKKRGRRCVCFDQCFRLIQSNTENGYSPTCSLPRTIVRSDMKRWTYCSRFPPAWPASFVLYPYTITLNLGVSSSKKCRSHISVDSCRLVQDPYAWPSIPPTAMTLTNQLLEPMLDCGDQLTRQRQFQDRTTE